MKIDGSAERKVLGWLIVIAFIGALITILTYSPRVRADEQIMGPVAKMANVNQGHFYLTLESCPAKFNLPITDPLYRAYAVDFEGTANERVVEACWVSPEIDWSQIPEQDRSRVVRAITILAPDGHYSYLWTDFEPVNSPANPAKGEF